jgi:hypothetical protein
LNVDDGFFLDHRIDKFRKKQRGSWVITRPQSSKIETAVFPYDQGASMGGLRLLNP